eukprot:maker-scaffold292_size219010-snap-gene-1.42 protein:Tk00324 transcript:maker-scaffold292_size219010-snap-gene-1.42-mRNA-1 annotation:"kiaa1143 homolog"
MSGRKRGGSAGGGKSGGLQYTKNEPSFIRKMKAQVGYRDTQSQLADKDPANRPADHDDIEDQTDEQPTVVVLKAGDLTAEEAKASADGEELTPDEPPPDGRVKFRRPQKREIQPSPIDESQPVVQPKKPKAQSSKLQLLSFNDDGDEEESD